MIVPVIKLVFISISFMVNQLIVPSGNVIMIIVFVLRRIVKTQNQPLT